MAEARPYEFIIALLLVLIVLELAALVLLAIGAAAFIIAAVGIAAHWVAPSLPWAVYFALGAVVSPPDVSTPCFPMATVIGWAVMRGVVTLAAALSIPRAVPGRDFVMVASFAVILVTVFVQGTLGPLIRLLGLSGADEATERGINIHEARRA